MSVETPIFPTAIKEKDKKRIMEMSGRQKADKKETIATWLYPESKTAQDR